MDIYDESGCITGSTPDQPMREVTYAVKPKLRPDIISRLREEASCKRREGQSGKLESEAADEIEKLRRENERLVHLVRDQQRTEVQDISKFRLTIKPIER